MKVLSRSTWKAYRASPIPRLNAAFAGHFGVPVLVVAGDGAACTEAECFLPGVRIVAVKDGIDKFSANCLHPEVAQARIREATAGALVGRGAAGMQVGQKAIYG